jgi:hypothetical protein
VHHKACQEGDNSNAKPYEAIDEPKSGWMKKSLSGGIEHGNMLRAKRGVVNVV